MDRLSVIHTVLFFAICIASPAVADTEIALVHGSFSCHSKWCKPGGTPFETLKKAASHKGYTLKPFVWSGGVSSFDIIEAAEDLVASLLSAPANRQFILIGHSNGGNVIAYATMLLSELYYPQIELLSEDETIVIVPESLKKPFLRDEKKKALLPSHTSEALQEKIAGTLVRLRAQQAQCTNRHRSPLCYPIDLVCIMGTPINTNRFSIDMRVTKQAVSLFSPNDFVQILVGKQLLPPHERRANIRARLALDGEAGTLIIDPCHKNIRHPIITSWLLDLPHILAAPAHKAAPHALRSGTVYFYDAKQPQFYSETEESLVDGSLFISSSPDDSAEDDDDSEELEVSTDAEDDATFDR